MSKLIMALLSVFLVFQAGRSYATLNIFDGQLYIPFFDYLWKFDKDCRVGCHYFSFRCFFPASVYSVCRDLQFMHQCCEQFTSTTTTSTTTTSTTTPSTTTSTEHPPVKLCKPTRPQMCQPEPGCTPSPHYQFGNKWLQQPGCEHKCWQHCFDQCACKTAAEGNCEYHPSTGMCLARRECQDTLFKDGDCRRANSFYSIGGLLCQSRESSQMNCENGTTIFAVNINGEPHTDKRGISYMADNDVLFEDMFNTRMEDDRFIDDKKDEDKKLYGSYAYGQANGMDKGQCLQYSIKVEQDGNYELALRAVEPIYRFSGQRIFSLTLNQIPVALHMDVGALSGPFAPVDIIANFRIETSLDSPTKRFITLKGHTRVKYESMVVVGMCISDCQLCDEYTHLDPGYVGSGLSLVRF